ncbi:MAG: hypothetical protein J0H43_10815 [Actinobacteria bacterium]|nr:hypothetical protein [Actinomycetota bacterium]
MRISDVLRRFRPAGAPGPAAAAGVPVDRGAVTAAELEPAFVRLEDVQRRAARLVDDATREVADRCHLVQQQVDAISADAQKQTGAEREAARERVRSASRRAGQQLVADAEATARHIDETAARRTAGLVDVAVARVRAQLDAASTPPPAHLDGAR